MVMILFPVIHGNNTILISFQCQNDSTDLHGILYGQHSHIAPFTRNGNSLHPSPATIPISINNTPQCQAPFPRTSKLSPVKHRCCSHWTDLFISRGWAAYGRGSVPPRLKSGMAEAGQQKNRRAPGQTLVARSMSRIVG